MKKLHRQAILIAACLACAAPRPAPGQGAAEARAQAAKAVAALKSGASEQEKDEACRVLARVGGKEEVAAIAALLGDEKLSHMARHALEPIPDPSVDDALREAAGKLKGRPLHGVIDSIGRRKDVKAAGLLAGLLAGADAEAASAAAVSLGRLGTTESAKALGAALGSAPAAVKPAVCDGALRCAEALAEGGKKEEAIALYDRLRAAGMAKGVRVAATRGAILARGAAGVPMLLEALQGTDPDPQAAALRLVYEWPGKEVTEALAGSLKGLAPDRQVALVQALGIRGDRSALPAVLALAKAGQGPARAAALRVLPQLADATVIVPLFDIAGGADAEAARAAQATLASLPGKDVDAAIVAKLEDPKLRPMAIELAGRRRATAALPVLLKALKDPQEPIRQAATKALADFASRDALAQLLPLLQEAQGRDVAAQAVLAMAERMVAGDPEAASDAAKKVQEAVKNEELAKRAQQVIDKAQKKPAGGKRGK